MTTKDIALGACLLIAGCGLIATRKRFSSLQTRKGFFGRVNERHAQTAGYGPLIIGGFLIVLGVLGLTGVLTAQ